MRLKKLDFFRGVAIILMVIFHLNYSLLNIFNIDILNFSDSFWYIIWKIAALLFIFIAWISFSLAEIKYWEKINNKYLKVILILSIIAWIITIITYLFNPEFYIRFWIIHFFALSFGLLLLFRRFKYYTFLLGILIVIIGIFFTPIIQNQFLYFLGFTYPWFSSSDFYPIFPYFGIMLFGYNFWLILSDKNKIKILEGNGKESIIMWYIWLIWRKSLVIYLIHQPIIISSIYLYKYIWNLIK